MGQSYFPNDIINKNLTTLINFNNHSLIQFYHRNLAYLIVIYIIFLSYYIYSKNLKILHTPFKIVVSFLVIQIFLGVFTLISGLNIYLASAHQISSVILVFSAINLYYFTSK